MATASPPTKTDRLTIADFLELLASRDEAWEKLGHLRGLLKDMSPEDRAEADKLSRRYRHCDAAITAGLVRLNRPVKLGDVTLHLSADRLNFIVLDAATGLPHGQHPDQCQGSRGLLFDYGAGKSRGR